MISVIILYYKVDTIYQAAAATGGMFIGLTVYAVFTKGDMTKKGGFLITCCECAFWLILFQFVFGTNRFLYLIFVLFIICLLSVFIVYDTQMIVGGTSRKF